jgi:hypothetical protein
MNIPASKREEPTAKERWYPHEPGRGVFDNLILHIGFINREMQGKN